MTRMLASHVAGFRLLRIVLLLALPAVLLGWEIFAQGLHDRAALRASNDGLTLLALTAPLMLDDMDGKLDANYRTLFLERAPALAEASGVKMEYSRLEHALQTSPDDARAVLQAAGRLASAVGDGAARDNGGDREANALLNLSSLTLPQLALTYRTLLEDVAACAGDSNCAQMQNIILANASTEFQARELGTGVIGARALSPDSAAYSRLLNVSYGLTFDAAHLRTTLLMSGTQGMANVSDLQTALAENNSRWTSNITFAWQDINQRLRSIFVNRATALDRWLAQAAAITLGAIVLGIGTAISLFRSTLRKLDELEEARGLAHAAQGEAERTSADLADLNRHMARVNADLAENLKALKSAQDQLVSKTRMEQMGQLTATIAHELRNPLGAVRTSTFLLQRKTRGRDLGIEGQILRINNGITRCDDIITQLLDFSRSKHIDAAPADLDSWLEQTIAEEAQRLPAEVTVNCEFGLTGLKVPFDPGRMQRAIGNLLNNASEAMLSRPEGADSNVPLFPTIWITTRQNGGFACVIVRDNGHGISPENLLRIREPLFTTKSFGTGLGLPAVEQILVQHGGSLEIESELGKGASFIMKLPLKQPEDMAA
jgi:signal transduction histidine kinase